MIKTVLLATAAALAWAAPAHAAWPDKPITLIVPYSAGGLTDTVTRVLSEELGRELGQPIVIENRPGAGGKIGLEQLKRAPKDGYTIALAVPATMVLLPLTEPNYKLEPLKDFEPITVAVDTFTVLVAHSSVAPTGSLKEFVAYAKANPGKLNYGTPGPGTSFHFNNVVLAQKLGIETTHVPYKGEAPALNDLAGGAIQYMLGTQSAKAYVDGGRIKALAVAASQRVASFPGVPTLKELGVDFKTDGWVGYVAPAGVSGDVLDRLNQAFVKALKVPKVQELFAGMGYIPVGNSRSEFRTLIGKSSQHYDELLKSGAVKLSQ